MTRLSYKTLLIIIFFLLIPIVFLLRLQQKPTQKVYAEWFNDSWSYRQAITITIPSSTADFTDLDTNISIGTSALVASGKLQSDCDDLRFTNVNGQVLPYFIDSGCNTSATKIWVRADLVPKNTTTYTVYLYYGNPSATSASDSTTFNLYNGLVGYWNFNENTGTSAADLSPNTNTAIFGSGSSAPGWTNGKYGIGMSFDGTDDEINLGSDPSLQITGTSISASAWVKTTNTQGGIISRYLPDTPWSGYSMSVSGNETNGKLGFWYGNGASWSFSNRTVNDGLWHHVVVTFDSTESRFYIDGILDATVPRGGGIRLSSDTAGYIGRETNQRNFSGLMDDVRIYNRALGSAEITKLYNTPDSIVNASSITTNPTVSFAAEELGGGPVAWWKFDEGVGISTADSSSSQNLGTITNAQWQTSDKCISNRCLFLDGSGDYIKKITAINVPTGSSSRTLSAWFKLTDTSGTYELAGYGNNSGVGNRFSLWIDNNGACGAGVKSIGIEVQSAAKLYSWTPDNNWHHLTGVFPLGQTNLNQSLIYLDGKLLGGTPCVNSSTTLNTTNTELIVGGVPAANSSWNFKGFVDDVKVYSYARSAAQIKQDYTSGLAGQATAQGANTNIGGQSAKALSDGLVGYWKFDEGVGTTTADSSGNSNTATFGTGGSAPSWSSGKYGVGMSFDGTDDNITTNLSLSNFTEGTLTAWINPQTPTDYGSILSTRSSANSLSLDYYPGGNLTAAFNDTLNGWTSISTAGIVQGNWQQIVFIWKNGEKAKIYLNGAEKSNRSIGNIQSFAHNLTIGVFSGIAHPYKGYLDEVRIYNRALSPTEVKALYEYAPGPVGYWKFDEGVGTTAFDSSGNGNNGGWLGTLGSQWTIGKIGKAGSFNGTDNYLSIPDNSLIEPPQITLSAWFKTTSSTEKYLLNKNEDSYYLRLNSGQLGFWINNVCASWLTTPNTYNDGLWHHVSATYVNTSKLIYVDGILQASNNSCVGGTLPQGPSSLLIGDRQGVSNSFWSGQIDDVKIYNYARTQKQILEDMSARGGSASGGGTASKLPILWYKFDEGFGSVVNNSGIGGTVLGTFGTGSSSPTWTDGKFNKSLNFDGVDDVIVANENSAVDITTNTISFGGWVYPTTSNRYQLILGKLVPNGSTRQYALYLTTNNTSQIYWTLNGVGGNTNYNISSPWSVNRWNHVFLVYNGSTVKIYLNGTEVYSGSFSGNIGHIASNLFIGSEPGFYRLAGKVDDLKIFNYALTADEIKQEYNQGATLVIGQSTQTIGATTTSLDYCIPGDTSPCAPPIAEWKFDEGVGTTAFDTSGNNFNGSSVLAPYSIGKIGNARRFNGNSNYNVNVTDQSLLKPNGDFSISVWINPTSNSALQGVISKMSSANTGYRLTLRNGGDVWCDIGNFNNSNGIKASVPYSANVWQHLECVRNGTTLYLYKNGVLMNSASVGTTAINETNALTIGQQAGEYFNGLIDQVKLYNYARTPAQIAYDYNRGGPVGWWKMDECQGTQIADWSGNANHGILSIGASGTQTSAGTCTTSGTAWGIGATGKINSSLNFDGIDDYISINRSTNIESPSITVSAWVYRSSISSSQHQIVTKTYNNDGSPPYGSYSLGYDRSNNNLAELFLGYTDNGFSTTFSSGDIPLNTWTHIVGTYDGQNAKIYLNGKLENSSQVNKTLKFDTTSTGNLYIGSGANGTYDFPGQIDDVRVYNYALTATQVKTLYNGGSLNFR